MRSAEGRARMSRPVIFGEVLFDVFADGQEVLGGAPFNVAWNLQGLGFEPLFISRVGDDERGARVLDAMRRWGLDVAGVQVDADRPTGTVDVRLEGAQPSYVIRPDQAYDFIDARAASRAFAEAAPSLLYHGTLAARSAASRDALAAIAPSGEVPRFLDANLRAPWSSRLFLERSLALARWVKLNDAELAFATEHDGHAEEGPEQGGERLLARIDAQYLVVTRGEEGACLLSRDARALSLRAPRVPRLAEPVGAGDGFSAVMIAGLLSGEAPATSLEGAVRFAANVCGLRGATCFDPTFYRIPTGG